jgi:DNA-binding MarR family transcriptional regulator
MERVIPLDEHVCFALYAASRAVVNRYRPLLDEIGLTYPQYLAMLVLWERGETTVKELGAALQLDSSTLSPLLKRIEAGGLVQRQRSATDERSVLVRLTKRGHMLQKRARPIATEVACATGLPLDELVELRETLKRLTATLDEEGGRLDEDLVHG